MKYKEFKAVGGNLIDKKGIETFFFLPNID